MEGDPHLVTKDGQDDIHPFTRLNALQHLVQSVMQAAVYLQDSESDQSPATSADPTAPPWSQLKRYLQALRMLLILQPA